MLVLPSSSYTPSATPQSGLLQGQQQSQATRSYSGHSGSYSPAMPSPAISSPSMPSPALPSPAMPSHTMPAHFVGAQEVVKREVLHQPISAPTTTRMVSPPARRVVSPRPSYSWRTQYTQPVVSGQSGVSSQLLEPGPLTSTTRYPSARSFGPGVQALGGTPQPRNFKAPTRARTPELQTRARDRQRVEVAARAQQVQPARSVSSERSVSTDQLRSVRHPVPSRLRTFSPQERTRQISCVQPTPRAAPLELTATEFKDMRAYLAGGVNAPPAGSVARKVLGPCQGHLQTTPPPAKDRSSSSPAAGTGSTNRSRSCSPSTVPRCTSSGSPEPLDVVDVTPPQPLSDRDSFEQPAQRLGSGSSVIAGRADGLGGLRSGFGGIGLGLGRNNRGPSAQETNGGVHLDNQTLLRNAATVPSSCGGVLTECDTNSPNRVRRQWSKESNGIKDARKRPMPLGEDGINIGSPHARDRDLNDSSMTSISFNLSPINAPQLSGGASSMESLRGALAYSDTTSTGFSLPPSSRVTPSASGAPSLLPSRRESPKDATDKENQGGYADIVIMGQAVESPPKKPTRKQHKGSSERAVSQSSKVVELVSFWERKHSGNKENVGKTRLRPSAAKRAVSSPCCMESSRHMSNKEAMTLRAAQDLYKRLTSPNSTDSSFDTHSSRISESPQSESNQEDSPMKKETDAICKFLDQSWRNNRKTLKALGKFISQCEGGSRPSSSSSSKAASFPKLRSPAVDEDRLLMNGSRSGSALESIATTHTNMLSSTPSRPREEVAPSSLEAALSSLTHLQCGKPDEAEQLEGSAASSVVKSPPAATQPEEEADGPLPGTSTLVSTKGVDEEKGEDERGRDADGARFSTASTLAAEPAVEPQPLESPRPSLPDSKATGEPDDEPFSLVQDTFSIAPECMVEPSIITEPPATPSAAESPEGRASTPLCSVPCPSVNEDEEQAKEGETEEEEEDEIHTDEVDEQEEEDSEEWDESWARPTEEGMARTGTELYRLEAEELKRTINIIVPEELGPDRKVSFKFHNATHEIVVPEQFDVGQQVPVTLSKRPFLERNPKHAYYRGHPQEVFPDRSSYFENLRHSPRTDVENSNLDLPLFRDRYAWYKAQEGKQGCPLLEYIEEVEEADDDDLAEAVELA